MTNNYRVDCTDQTQVKAVIMENHLAKNPSHFFGYVSDGLPGDREGLIAVMHDLILAKGGTLFWNEMAANIAKQTGQRVYIIMTETRWHMMLFAIERREEDELDCLWYDEFEIVDGKREYANDQFIAHYDPDGTYGFDGAS